MLKQLMLFFSPAEMLIFNSLFENRAAAKGERLISITPADFQKLRQALIEAEITRPAEEFVNGFVEEMINCGLLIRVRAKSEFAPIGELRAIVQNDEIAGPKYIVERGVFQIAVPLKLKIESVIPREVCPAPAIQTSESQSFDVRLTAVERLVEKQQQEINDQARLLRECFDALKIKTAFAPEATWLDAIQQMISSPKFKEFSSNERLLMIIFLSPLAKVWFLRKEMNELIREYRGQEIFGKSYRLVLSNAVAGCCSLFKRKEITAKEKEIKGLSPQPRYYYRLSEEGIARARKCLKKYAAAAGVDYDELIKGAEESQKEQPATLKVEEAPFAPPAPTPTVPALDSGIATLAEIVGNKFFDKMNRRDKVLFLVRVSPLAYRWFKTRELKAFIKTMPNISNYWQAMMAQAVEESMFPLAQQGYFTKRDLLKPDLEGKSIFSMCRVEYLLTREGRERAGELLKQFRLSATPSLVSPLVRGRDKKPKE